ncbi:DNA methyltransferase [Prevotella intermedia]|uniref:DNA methyltransferase n=1 Tax=Prevotella intermedia TaxID=28131 RepID=A0A2M8TKA8_PREIN|nr:DNA adenine methylase [Prevotella intermedia]PJI24350.1 DNA methyltransferase [Prevotella intermedia]
MKKLYLSAPLPFQGQKRMFAKEYIKVLQQFPDGTTFVDLFGGSGLLSHIAKCQKPNSTVVYNDFDGYRQRLERISQTNELLEELRAIVDIPRSKPILGEVRKRVLDCIRKHEQKYGYVDYITLSASLLFSMKYATCFAEMEKETLYNRVKSIKYPLCTDYLDGLTITSCDYKEVFDKYKDVPNVVFLVDPPYLSTDSKTYRMYWKLSDYLDVLTILAGHRFIYFTSNKSSIVELCEWIGKNRLIGNPFENCHRREFNAHMNYSASYTDIMIYTDAV